MGENGVGRSMRGCRCKKPKFDAKGKCEKCNKRRAFRDDYFRGRDNRIWKFRALPEKGEFKDRNRPPGYAPPNWEWARKAPSPAMYEDAQGVVRERDLTGTTCP